MAEAYPGPELDRLRPSAELEVRGPPLSVADRYYSKYYAVGE